jgi:hypothetical protein
MAATGAKRFAFSNSRCAACGLGFATVYDLVHHSKLHDDSDLYHHPLYAQPTPHPFALALRCAALRCTLRPARLSLRLEVVSSASAASVLALCIGVAPLRQCAAVGTGWAGIAGLCSFGCPMCDEQLSADEWEQHIRSHTIDGTLWVTRHVQLRQLADATLRLDLEQMDERQPFAAPTSGNTPFALRLCCPQIRRRFDAEATLGHTFPRLAPQVSCRSAFAALARGLAEAGRPEPCTVRAPLCTDADRPLRSLV